jgi:hypothetical protein
MNSMNQFALFLSRAELALVFDHHLQCGLLGIVLDHRARICGSYREDGKKTN